MPGIRVVSDTACDLPDDVVALQGIGLVPLTVRFGASEFVDRVELSTKDFWTRCGASSELPATAAPSPGAFAEAFRQARRSGATGVVCVTLSSRLSATIEAARAAARDVADEIPVRVVDSLNVTLGQGLIVLAATRAAAAPGATVDGVADYLERLVPTVRVFGALDTLDNLKKGGRIGGAQALIGSLLSIKPVIEVRNGVVETESKQRTRGRSLQYLASKVREAGAIEQLAVMSADASDLHEFLDLIAEVKPVAGLLVGDIGPVIGTHAGPGAIGVAWTPATGDAPGIGN